MLTENDCTCAKCLKRKKEMNLDDKIDQDADTDTLYEHKCLGYSGPDLKLLAHKYFDNKPKVILELYRRCERCEDLYARDIENERLKKFREGEGIEEDIY